MRDSVDSEIFSRFPHYVRAIVVGRGVNNIGGQVGVEDLLREAEARCEALFAKEQLTAHPRILAWREAYRVLDMQPGKNYSAVEALARRARGGSRVPYINTLVALMNGFSLKHLVPCGGDDLQAAEGDLTLRLATGEEEFVPLGGEEVSHPEPGEVIYVDDGNQVLCRRWNWRQGDATKVTPESRQVLANIDCLPPVGQEEAARMAEELALLVERYCGGEVEYRLITADDPIADLD